MARPIRSSSPGRQGGFTYLMLLLGVAIAGVVLAALGTSWHMMARRDREAELVWRGTQYQHALTSYARVSAAVLSASSATASYAMQPDPAMQPAAAAPVASAAAAASAPASAPAPSAGPLELKDLLEDRRTGKLVRHLRQLYPDPVTGQRWGVQRSPDGRIAGVYSLSDAAPVRRSLGVQSYRELVFGTSSEGAAAAASSASAASGAAGARGAE
ncbi:type II secretion system protein [Aquabacterium sp.]|uniref:type II secretion system protein n=1 Tax=Aquabacterium sp. TaxID=1872578 RepID=UPI0035B017CF